MADAKKETCGGCHGIGWKRKRKEVETCGMCGGRGFMITEFPTGEPEWTGVRPEPPVHQPPQELTDMLDSFLSEVVQTHYDSQSEDTFVECKLCGEWEGHTEDCPVPAIETYMKAE